MRTAQKFDSGRALSRRLLLLAGACSAVFGCKASTQSSPLESADPKTTRPNPSAKPAGSTVTREPPRGASNAQKVENESEPPDSSSSAPEQSKARPRIHLQPLGLEFSAAEVNYILTALAVFFPHPVSVAPAAPLPQEAYYAPRSRYRAEKLLDRLVELTPVEAQVVVGLTTVDISTTKPPYEDWGILGLATVGGKQCVISRFRAQRGATGPDHIRARLAKTVVHEVGHTLGLRHCPHHGCLMEDGKGSVLTSDHEYDFCDTCRAQVGEHLNPRDLSAIPWPRPEIHWPMP